MLWMVITISTQSIMPKCGTALEIYEEGRLISKGHSPFKSEKYVIDLPPDAQPPKSRVRKGKEQERH